MHEEFQQRQQGRLVSAFRTQLILAHCHAHKANEQHDPSRAHLDSILGRTVTSDRLYFLNSRDGWSLPNDQLVDISTAQKHLERLGFCNDDGRNDLGFEDLKHKAIILSLRYIRDILERDMRSCINIAGLHRRSTPPDNISTSLVAVDARRTLRMQQARSTNETAYRSGCR